MKLPRFVFSPLTATAVLLGFWLLLVATNWNKSLTYDELVHAPAGYSYWKYNDYRLNPENGNLPQRIAGLAFLDDKFPLPPTSLPVWQLPDEWELGDYWFHQMGYNVPAMLHRGRAVASLEAVALAALVWLWARRLFGPLGGLLSLLVCVLNPTILANGGLMTSDTAAALFFLAATWAIWAVLHRVSIARVVLCALAVGGLFVSKSSALLVLPVALVLALARLLEGSPLPVDLGPLFKSRSSNLKTAGIAGWRRQLGVFAALGAFQVFAVFGFMWGFYGFRYSAFAPGVPSQAGSKLLWEGTLGEQSLPEIVQQISLPQSTLDRALKLFDDRAVPIYGWDQNSEEALKELKAGVLAPDEAARLDAAIAGAKLPFTVRFIQLLARHQVLPEAYLLGTTHAWRFAQMRSGFFNGAFTSYGSSSFFPYTFLVKTPLPLFGLAALAIAGAFVLRRGPGTPSWKSAFYRTLPLWTLFGFYWIAVVNSRLNIGHRHILTTYPPLFVLCGAAGAWITSLAPGSPERRAVPALWRYVAIAVLALAGLSLVETTARFPDYLSYFNGIVTPSNGYRHFVDSTIDWGQDLPGVRRYIAQHPSETNFYLSYFGNDDPRAYGITAHFLPSNPGRFLKDFGPILFLPLTTDPTPAEVRQMERDNPNHTYVGAGGTQNGKRYAVLVRKPETWNLGAGTYFISATNLQVEWSDSDEDAYHQIRDLVRPFFDNTAGQSAPKRSMVEWRELLTSWEGIREARLAAYLRAHDPDAEIGYSILVFKVSDADLAQALDGPRPPQGYLHRKLSER